jgi:hypothetical protein
MTPRTKLRIAACASLLGAACGEGSDASSTTAPVEQPAAVTAEAPAPDTGGSGELQFTHALVGGGELDLSTLADKPTALWFWAPT